MNVFVRLKGYNDEDNDFFLEDLDGSPEELWLLASLTAASQERKDEGYPIFDYYVIPDEDLNSFKEFYYSAKKLSALEFVFVCKKFSEEKIKEWWGIIS